MSNKIINVESIVFDKSNFHLGNDAIIYLPGWSLNVTSNPVKKICSILANTFRTKTFAFQTISKKIVNNSLLYEANEINNCIHNINPKVTKVILITHSQGTIKTIHLAKLLKNKTNLKIHGIIFITPVGLYTLRKLQLQIRFILEAIKIIFTNFPYHLIVSILKFIKNEIATKNLPNYIKKINQQSKELTTKNSIYLEALKNLNLPIIFILAENDYVSSIEKIKEALKKSNLKNYQIITIKNSNHAMPYTMTSELVNKLSFIRKW